MEFAEALRHRLAEVVEDHSQAEVARAGGVPESSVYHYLRERRVPVEFCVRLCEHLGVNLNWLLTGRGTSDASAGELQAGELAGEVEGFIKVLTALERDVGYRISQDVVAGKFSALNDALAELRRTRDRVRESIRPLAEQLLQEMRRALDKRNLIRGADLDKALRYLLLFDPPDELRLRMESLLATYAILEGRYGESIKLQEAHLWRYLASGKREPLRILKMASKLVVGFNTAGQTEEAVALADAVVAGVRVGVTDRAMFHQFRVARSFALVEGGRLKEGLAEMMDALPRTRPDFHAGHYGKVQRVWILGGLMTTRDALRMVPEYESVGRVLDLVRLAIWEEDPELLRLCLDQGRRVGVSRPRITPSVMTFATMLMEALEGSEQVLEEWRIATRTAPRGVGWEAAHLFRESKLCRVTGDRRGAARILRKLVERLNDGDLPLPPSLMDRANIMREVDRLNLKLPANGICGLRPDTWRELLIEKGYAYFKNWLPAPAR